MDRARANSKLRSLRRRPDDLSRSILDDEVGYVIFGKKSSRLLVVDPGLVTGARPPCEGGGYFRRNFHAMPQRRYNVGNGTR